MIINSLKNLIEADDKQVRETFSAVYLSSSFSFFLIFGKIFSLCILAVMFGCAKT